MREDYLPADRGMFGLGLIMQLAGSVFAVVAAMVGLGQLMAASEMARYGESSTTGTILVLSCVGVVRSLVHRNAGVQLLYGSRPAAAIRGYLLIASLHTVLWVVVAKYKFEAPVAGWLPMALVNGAWPAALWIALRVPALRPVDGTPVARGADAGFDGLAVLMLVLGLIGALYSAATLMGFRQVAGGAGGLAMLLQLCLVALVARSLLHAHAGGQLLGELTLERAERALGRYIGFGVVTGLGLGGVFLLMTMRMSFGLEELPFAAGVCLLLLLWPLTVRRMLTTRRLELYGDHGAHPRLARAPDQGRTTLGWLHLALGSLALASALPPLLFDRLDRAAAQAMELEIFSTQVGRAPWLALVTAGLQLWAGAELIGMTARHRTVATVYGLTAAAVALYQWWPMLRALDGSLRLIPGIGQTMFASLAAALIVPLVTIALVQRTLPPPRLGASVGSVFD